MYFLKQPKKCPSCQQKAGARILWGMPYMTDKVESALNNGTLVLGGCVVDQNSEEFQCLQCGHMWSRYERLIIGEINDVFDVVNSDSQNKAYDVLCNEYENLCKQKWNDLVATDVPGERFCESCNKTVLLVKRKKELELLRRTGQCVAYCGRGKAAAPT